jgi:ectoine hydroxylase-related dioxygenase (phytanoyl-CoA dioxygenase family)
VLFTKPAGGGTIQPWHQDAGNYWGLDRDPALQIWTALDDAPEEAGCLEVFPRSHSQGLATPLGGLVPAPIVTARGANEAAVPLPVEAGESLLVHSLVWHRSGLNRTAHPRRAVTITYMAGDTRCIRKRKAPRTFVRVFDS